MHYIIWAFHTVKRSPILTDSLFSTLPLPKPLLDNLQSLGFSTMTPIQQESLPIILAGQDVIAKAKTGSGKTAAFAINLLTRIHPEDFYCQGLVLCPTRELATQVATETRRLARFLPNIKVVTLCGGQPIGPQIGSLAYGAHIVVGTPGRIQDHLRKGTVSLKKVNTLVLDEADRMLDMGFINSINTIISHTTSQRQTLLYSATYPASIRSLSQHIQKQPIEVTTSATDQHMAIDQQFYLAENNDKSEVLLKLLGHWQPLSAVVFCNTKKTCKAVGTALFEQGYKPLVLHGDLAQKERDQILVRFANRSSRLLIATDVAARGLDIDDLAAVINYDLSRDPGVHVHRIGRTGRAGKSGIALNLYTSREQYKLDAISDYLQYALTVLSTATLKKHAGKPEPASMVTLCIDGGRKHKVRPGDILGALTGEAAIPGNQVGKINIFDFVAYVAVNREYARKALQRLEKGKIKGRQFKVRRL